MVYDRFLELSLRSTPEEPLNDAYMSLIHMHQNNTAPAREWMDSWLADQGTFANEAEGLMMVFVDRTDQVLS